MNLKTIVQLLQNAQIILQKDKAEKKEHDFDAVYDEYETRFGIRKTEFKADGFYLNDKKIKLMGVNRNQSFPYMGYAMPESIQRNDADIIKNELGMNMVRTSHYPQSKYFLDRCDEIGLLVFSEIAGGYNIGDDDWKNGFCQSVEEMVLYNRNHPSVILWGVRVNGSNDDEELYTTTNNAAHNIDKLRQTAGTRNIKKSNLLEDVYAYNDFSYDGENEPIEKRKDVTSDETKAYIISEYNGYMYPSKSFDTESDKLEHALRHAKIMNGYYKDKLIAGGIAWCMTDYNANNGFGSADGICYHGIMDMFRNPKLVASLYSCYTNENVLEISSSMSRGEHKAEIPRAYGFQREGNCRCRYPIYDARTKGAFFRFDGIREGQEYLHSQPRHAQIRQGEYEDTPPAAPRQRDCIRCR